MTQPSSLSIEVPLSEVMRKPTLGAAIEYCAELAGYSYDKELEAALAKHGVKVDATQLTRWKQGAEGIKWEKFCGVMDACGNDAPLLWMVRTTAATTTTKQSPRLPSLRGIGGSNTAK
jgi:hypothetical protein